MQIFLITAGVLVFLCIVAAATLLWVLRHPLVIIKKLRGTWGTEDVLTYPPDYDGEAGKVNIEKNLEYPSKLPCNTYDFYLPKENASNCPLVIWIHGGGFFAGDKSGVSNVATILAAEGFAVMAVNYVWAPEHPYPAATMQLNNLLRELQVLRERHPQADFDRIFLAGDSAGAQIAAQLAAMETNPRLAAEMGASAVLPKGALKGTVLTCGPYDFPALGKVKGLRMKYSIALWGRAYLGNGWKKSAVTHQTVVEKWVTSDYPPSYITDGNTFSFEVQGRRLGEALRRNNVPVTELYFDLNACGEVPHEYLFLLERSDAVQALGEIIDFLNERS